MTPTTLAETILRDVPIRGRMNAGRKCLDELVFKKDVEAALTAAMDPSHDNETSAIAERAGEVLERLQKADEYEPLGHDGWEAADLITALLAQNAALRAERDASNELGRAFEEDAGQQRERAEAAEAKVEKLRGALEWIEALDDHAECCGKEYTECCGQPEYGLDRAKRVARNARAALSTTEASHDPQA